jgi:hypothetical protein
MISKELVAVQAFLFSKGGYIMLNDFKAFIMKGNVFDMAVGAVASPAKSLFGQDMGNKNGSRDR